MRTASAVPGQRFVVLDRTLVERAQRGDRDAYEALVPGAARRLYPVAHRILRDPDQADDAVQLALVAIWRDLPSLREIDKFEAWTYRLVVRFSLAEGRRRRRVGVRSVRLGEITAESKDRITEIDVRDQLDRAFEALSPEHRAVVVLHHYLGLSLGEVAEITGVPYGTVGSRLHHATRALRAALDAGERPAVPEGQRA